MGRAISDEDFQHCPEVVTPEQRTQASAIFGAYLSAGVERGPILGIEHLQRQCRCLCLAASPFPVK